VVGGDARPNSQDEEYRGRDRAQKEVGLRNVGGGKEGSGSVGKYSDTFFFLFEYIIYLLLKYKNTHAALAMT